MGMPISIHVRGGQPNAPFVERAVGEAFEVLVEADGLFSTYRPDSQVSRIRRRDLALTRAHPLVHEVVTLCEEATSLTEGAFTHRLPDQDGIRRFDPTGLVKGWAADRAAAVLATIPAHTFCLNAGGDVIVGGDLTKIADPQDRAPWRIGVEDPRDRSRIAEVVPLHQGGVATSGTAARGPHLCDPATGAFVERAGSVTVVGPSLMWADVWATALFVGPETLRRRFWQVAGAYRVIAL